MCSVNASRIRILDKQGIQKVLQIRTETFALVHVDVVWDRKNKHLRNH
jgi:hypothetical protein